MTVRKNITKEFRISKRESVKENIERILNEQIDYILDFCEGEQVDIHKSIHEIRKSIKRIRAVLRLIREEIGYSTYYRENVFYRDINRSTSELRTSNVLISTLNELSSAILRKIPSSELNPLIEKLHEERDNLLSRTLSDNRVFRDLSGKFRKGRERIPDLPVVNNGFEVFRDGISRIYRQGKDLFEIAKEDPEMHRLHDLRKRIKYLWYQIEILRPIYPGPLKAYATSLENTAEKLGVYHDLEVLEEYLGKNRSGLNEKLLQTLLDGCEFKKTSLLPGIIRMAGAAYSEEPESLVHRMGEYWNIFYRNN